jgi:micrococcal nuclease
MSRGFAVLFLAFAASACAPVVSTQGPGVATRSGADCRAVDGDSIACAGETIRISNIDTPEKGPLAKCAAEAALAERASAFTAARLTAGDVVVIPDKARPRDRYGRTLARVEVAGGDLGDLLVAAGLARPWDGKRRGWCG